MIVVDTDWRDGAGHFIFWRRQYLCHFLKNSQGIPYNIYLFLLFFFMVTKIIILFYILLAYLC